MSVDDPAGAPVQALRCACSRCRRPSCGKFSPTNAACMAVSLWGWCRAGAGPTLALSDRPYSWRWAFYINIPIAYRHPMILASSEDHPTSRMEPEKIDGIDWGMLAYAGLPANHPG